ncbi:hypothetical protein JOD54_000990 [Actinokineospora baliensis]|uniref:hypothetical protein n=1 Tax=Actinokineospora baliensis TaxID=547056 RepID=UPI00195A18BB|nr:hypothetical protein [Actinokineospora baliensis]MBM7770786.1 hypothetical protein [Actinokineospora baliensis]
MDERKISEVFNAAVGDVPPPSFERGDVLARSARLTRKRNGLIAGSALGLAVLVGGIATGVALWSGPTGESGNDSAAPAPATVAGGNTNRPLNEVPGDSPRSLESNSPLSPPKQGGATDGDAGPRASGTPGGCGAADRELAAALAGELPSAVSTSDAKPSPLGCPAGGRSAAFEIADGPRKGLVSIMLTPSGVDQMLAPPWADRSGAQGAVIKTASGATLVLSVEPAAGSAAPPVVGDDLRGIGDDLAGKY